MIQKDKELLFKDLCARLPYGCFYKAKRKLTTWNRLLLSATTIDNMSQHFFDDIKPYLRPMSSMTEEERKEYKHLVALSGNSYGAADLVDWLNKKMFAYRTIDGKDMFELGLALEAPEGMYK